MARLGEDLAMLLIAAGWGVFAVTGIAFWRCLPRDGKTHRFVDTEWEPYVGVAFTAGAALGFTMTLSGALDMIKG
jgi:hypothetical protein